MNREEVLSWSVAFFGECGEKSFQEARQRTGIISCFDHDSSIFGENQVKIAGPRLDDAQKSIKIFLKKGINVLLWLSHSGRCSCSESEMQQLKHPIDIPGMEYFSALQRRGEFRDLVNLQEIKRLVACGNLAVFAGLLQMEAGKPVALKLLVTETNEILSKVGLPHHNFHDDLTFVLAIN